jgi:phosphatidylserine decarboxylase
MTDGARYQPIINELILLLEHLGGRAALEDAVKSARIKIGPFLDKYDIKDASTFLDWINEKLLKWVPSESLDATAVYKIICVFYFIFDQLPLLNDQTPINPSSVGKNLTPLSAWIVKFAKVIGNWMDKEDSWNFKSWGDFEKATKYRTFECEDPTGQKFKTFNQFFGRHLKVPRKIVNLDDNKTVVYPADSHYDNAFDINANSNTTIPDGQLDKTIQVKGLTWRIADLLRGSHYGDHFANGVWMHSFLNTYNYHRLHAPVSGRILEASVIPGAAYLDVVAKDGEPVPRRPIWVYGSEPDALDLSGYQFLQARGLIVIDTAQSKDGDIGLVAGTWRKSGKSFFLSFPPSPLLAHTPPLPL